MAFLFKHKQIVVKYQKLKKEREEKLKHENNLKQYSKRKSLII